MCSTALITTAWIATLFGRSTPTRFIVAKQRRCHDTTSIAGFDDWMVSMSNRDLFLRSHSKRRRFGFRHFEVDRRRSALRKIGEFKSGISCGGCDTVRDPHGAVEEVVASAMHLVCSRDTHTRAVNHRIVNRCLQGPVAAAPAMIRNEGSGPQPRCPDHQLQ